ncbi:MAG: hypothetical protein M1828_005901 [Chrysothrix sp. TS-e1954]|nr:MAG: hypothetical protein M1828_005901 [Chrysothrix sp. TS-e1954]
MDDIIDVPTLIRLFFVAVPSFTLIASASSTIHDSLLIYGSRGTNQSNSAKGGNQTASGGSGSLASRVLAIVSFQVPHDWFHHFYALSLVASAFWAYQIFTGGLAFTIVAANTKPQAATMTVDQISLVWTLVAVQGTRRLYECLVFGKKSSSTMWIGHWILGIGFYFLVSMAVWVEGIPTLLETKPLPDFKLRAPSLRTFVGLPIFILASGMQYDAHEYLGSLKKYTLPMHPIFQVLICPHYFAECLIYLSLSILAAPAGDLLNRTIFSVVFFTIILHGITSKTTRAWYAQKFGEDKIKGRWNMIPFVF